MIIIAETTINVTILENIAKTKEILDKIATNSQHDFSYRIYKKREYYQWLPGRPELVDYSEIWQFRDSSLG